MCHGQVSGQTEAAENYHLTGRGVRKSLVELAGFEPGLAEKAGSRQAKGKQFTKAGKAERGTRMLYSVAAPSHHLSTSLPCWRVATLSRTYIRRLCLPFPLLCGSGRKARVKGQQATMFTWAGPPSHHLVPDNQMYIWFVKELPQNGSVSSILETSAHWPSEPGKAQTGP